MDVPIEIVATRDGKLMKQYSADDMLEAVDTASNIGTWYEGITNVSIYTEPDVADFSFDSQADALDLFEKMVGRRPWEPFDNDLS